MRFQNGPPSFINLSKKQEQIVMDNLLLLSTIFEKKRDKLLPLFYATLLMIRNRFIYHYYFSFF